MVPLHHEVSDEEAVLSEGKSNHLLHQNKAGPSPNPGEAERGDGGKVRKELSVPLLGQP